MTSALKIESGAYLYGQALDNEGGVDYRSILPERVSAQCIDPSDPSLMALRGFIDYLHNAIRPRRFGRTLVYRFQAPSTIVVTVKPLSLDVNGRISPVLVLLQSWQAFSEISGRAFLAIESDMGRQLSTYAKSDISRFAKVLALPRWLVRPCLYLLSSRIKHD
jgi:hypothetical protein